MLKNWITLKYLSRSYGIKLRFVHGLIALFLLLGAVENFRGARVQRQFLKNLNGIAQKLDLSPEDILTVLLFETKGTLSTEICNKNTKSVGLLQFHPRTAQNLGTSYQELQQMSQSQQLQYVEKYLRPYRYKIHSLFDLYLAIIYPERLIKNKKTLFSKNVHPRKYQVNSCLDYNQDGCIDRQDVCITLYKYRELSHYIYTHKIF